MRLTVSSAIAIIVDAEGKTLRRRADRVRGRRGQEKNPPGRVVAWAHAARRQILVLGALDVIAVGIAIRRLGPEGVYALLHL